MTQQLMMMWGAAGQQVSLLGGNGILDAQLGTAAAGSVPVLTFATISAASSSRLVDFPLLTVPTGTLAYTGNVSGTVPSVHAYWRRMTTPTVVTADGITIVKPLGGASREVWVRLEGEQAYWQQRLNFLTAVVDPSGADENFGDVTSPLLTALELERRIGRAFPGGEVFVSAAGSDTTGNGADENPFLTIQAAIDFVTPLVETGVLQTIVIKVGPGEFPDSFRLVPWVFVVGSGIDSTTVAAATGAGVVGAQFAGAAEFPAGISNCSISDNLIINFAAAGSTGQGTFIANNVRCEGNITAIGANAQNRVQFVNVVHEGSLTTTNISADLSGVDAALLGGNWTFQATDAYTCNVTVAGGGTFGVVHVIWTGSDTGRQLAVSFFNPISQFSALTISGKGCQVEGQINRTAALPDADANISWFNGPPGTVVAISGGTECYEMTPTAARTVTLGTPLDSPSFVQLKNHGAFPIAIVIAGSDTIVGGSTWIPPNGEWSAFFNSGSWCVQNGVQSGSVVLVAGVSALIPADITASSTITATLKVFNTATGFIAAKSADRVVGTKAGGGGFKLTSVSAAGVTTVADVSTYDWQVTQ